MNSHGEVIGVAVATFKQGQNLNFAVPSSYLAAMLATVGPVSPLNASSRNTSSAIDSVGGKVTDAIQITHKVAVCRQGLRFSIRNSLPHTIEGVKLLFVYRDKSGDPVDYVEKSYSWRIPPGLAKDVGDNGPYVPSWMSFKELGKKRVSRCDGYWEEILAGERFDLSPIEIRILGFRIVEE